MESLPICRRLTFAATATLAVFVSPLVALAEDRPMTPRDLWSIRRPVSVAVSPDGARIAYELTTRDLDENTSNTDLWWVPAAGGSPVRLTHQTGRDAGPAWSGDGAWLYFLSKRNDEPTQVYRLPTAGGEAEKMTDLVHGATGLALSGDGKRMLVSSKSPRECADQACVARHDEEGEERRETGLLFDGLLYRHWDSWRGGDRSHVFLVEIGSGEDPVDLTPGDVDCPPVSLGSSHDFVLSPDGRHAALVVNRAPLVAASTDNDIEVVEIASGKRTVYSDGDGSDAAPRFDPRGEMLAWISMQRPGYESDKHALRLRSLDRRAGVLYAPDDPDLSISDFAFTPDGESIVFTAQRQGRMSLWHQLLGDSNEAPPKRLVEGGRVGSFDVSPDGKFVAFVLQSASSAPEIWRLDLAGGETSRITSHNDTLMKELELGRVDEMWFDGAAGDRVHAWVIHPPASTMPAKGKVPVVWLVHGGPQGAWLDDQHPRWAMQQFAALGYYAVAVNFHGSTGYGQEFTDSINRDWGGKPYQDLLLGLEAAREKLPRADLNRVCAAGGSYGGYMVNWMLGHAGDKFRCYVSHAGVYDLRSMYGATEELWFPEWDLGGTFWTNPESYEKWSPSASAERFKTPTLVIHGQLDFRVPVTQGMQLFTALQRQGVASKFLYYPDEGHWVGSYPNAAQWWSEIEDWLATWLD